MRYKVASTDYTTRYEGGGGYMGNNPVFEIPFLAIYKIERAYPTLATDNIPIARKCPSAQGLEPRHRPRPISPNARKCPSAQGLDPRLRISPNAWKCPNAQSLCRA